MRSKLKPLWSPWIDLGWRKSVRKNASKLIKIQLAENLKDRLHEIQLHTPKQTVIAASNPTGRHYRLLYSLLPLSRIGCSKTTRRRTPLPDKVYTRWYWRTGTKGGRGPGCLFAVVSRSCDDDGAMARQEWWSGGCRASFESTQRVRGCHNFWRVAFTWCERFAFFYNLACSHSRRKRGELLRVNFLWRYLLPKHGASSSLPEGCTIGAPHIVRYKKQMMHSLFQESA